MHKFIPFHNIPLEDWKSSHAKWVQCLIDDKQDWQICSVCNAVRFILRHSSINCAMHCPLSISMWCVAEDTCSRLSEFFIGEDGDYQSKDSWRQEVMDYLTWLDLEIEAAELAEDQRIFG